jgi:hypothetical protein
MNNVKKIPWYWDSIHQIAFDSIKTAIAKEVVLAYPDFTKLFDTHTDASTEQLGVVITQDNIPIVFFRQKLSDAQSKYKLKLLALVETLKKFNEMLWGQPKNVYTNNKNLTRNGLGSTTNRVTCWRILLEEYGPMVIYIKGICNTFVDAVSQLDYDPKVSFTNKHNHAM